MNQEKIPSSYYPELIEKKWSSYWESLKYYQVQLPSSNPPFCMVMPPPNVTGRLHMGHALNNTLQDIIARYKRLNGFNVLWVPGCDHAGIATQNVIERELKKESKTRFEIGREAFLKKTWDWKFKYGSAIIEQLKRLGFSCDWSHERFTMDEGLSDAVQEVFISLFHEDLIYQDYYLVNWCPRCETALSDIEVEHKLVNGNLYYIQYNYEENLNKYVEIATTRPETLLGDVALAVHPQDERYTDLLGKQVIIPLINRKIPIIADETVDPNFGTGVVKITPAHDFNDFATGVRHNLNRINILNSNGTLNENGKEYQGLDRLIARTKIVEDLSKNQSLVKILPHEHSVGHCYRCSTIIEPYYSKQWFVKMQPLAQRTLKAIEGDELKFVPSNWKNEFKKWLDNIQDWCISRQIWWGHRIPVYNCNRCSKQIASKSIPEYCPRCTSTTFTQDPDVLDTWFSSALWPFSTLGWPNATTELQQFYPTNILVTGWDILFFWVARMTMMGLKFMNQIPFKEVYIHSIITDEHGKKMSKSKGNVIDPLDLVEKYGADTLRFTLAWIENHQRYVSLTPDKIESSRNFINKIYNAMRFLMMSLDDTFKPITLSFDDLTSLEDQWIWIRTGEIFKKVTNNYENYETAELCQTLYHFIWHEVCDWYLECVKTKIVSEGKNQAINHLIAIFEVILKMLHPIIPFVTEELYHQLPNREANLSLEKWINYSGSTNEKQLFVVEKFNRLMEMVTAIRTIRSEFSLLPNLKLNSSYLGDQSFIELLKDIDIQRLLKLYCKLENIQPVSERPLGTVAAVVSGGEIYLNMSEHLDVSSEYIKKIKELEKLNQYIQNLKNKLLNDDFVSRAPNHVIENEKNKLTQSEAKADRLQNMLKYLKNK
jgi:valyl-tRNA synthetase